MIYVKKRGYFVIKNCKLWVRLVFIPIFIRNFVVK